MADPGEPQIQTIVFFDGVCHLCNGFVDFVITRDRLKRLQFAPLQGETARRLLGDEDRSALASVIVWENGKISRESAAIARVFSSLGGGWSVLGRAMSLVPLSLRNVVYRWVAKNRYAWFGERDVCRLPTAEERGRLLD